MAHKFKDAEGEWEDCTEQFTTACGSLAPGELCADPAFSLRQSIAAIELMDPKMDAGMELYRHHADIASAEDAFAKGLKRGGHTPEEVVALMDEVFVQIVVWLEGHSLAQTVFTCVFMLEPQSAETPVLQAFCMNALKLVESVYATVMAACVTEEEDFHPSRAGFSFCEDVSIDEAAKIGDRAIREVDAGGDAPDALAAMVTRLKLIMALVASLQSTRVATNAQSSQRHLNSAKVLLRSAAATVKLGVARGAEASPKAFQPFINRHLLPSTPPRELQAPSREEAFGMLTEDVDEILRATRVAECKTLRATLDFFEDLGAARPRLLARAKLFELFTGGGTGKILGRFDLKELALAEAYAFDAVTLTDHEAFGGSESVGRLVAAHGVWIGEIFTDLLRIQCHNRARQRRKLTKLLDKLALAANAAHDITGAFRALALQRGTPLPPEFSLVHLAHTLTTEVVTKVLLLGFELGLLAPHEWHAHWFYLDYSLERLEHQYTLAGQRHEAAAAAAESQRVAKAAGGGGGGKGGKKGKKKGKKSPKEAEAQQHMAELSIYRERAGVTRLLCQGLLRVVSGMWQEGRHLPDSRCFSSPERLYRRRFRAFEGLEYPQYVPFGMYNERAAAKALDGIQPLQLYGVAQKALQAAQERLAKLLSAPKPPSPSLRRALEGLAEVLKGNTIAVRLACITAASGQPRRLDFEFAERSEHPALRLS